MVLLSLFAVFSVAYAQTGAPQVELGGKTVDHYGYTLGPESIKKIIPNSESDATKTVLQNYQNNGGTVYVTPEQNAAFVALLDKSGVSTTPTAYTTVTTTNSDGTTTTTVEAYDPGFFGFGSGWKDTTLTQDALNTNSLPGEIAWLPGSDGAGENTC